MTSLDQQIVRARPSADRVESAKARASLLRKLADVEAPAPTIGRFVLEERIGAGAAGVVYAAHDPLLDRMVALKLLRPDSSDPQARQRLVEEAKSLAKLSHRNVVSVFDAGIDDGDVFVAMERVDGQTLDQWLDTPRSWTETVEALHQAGAGLAAAHQRGLVHRDFKPRNVMVSPPETSSTGAVGRVRVMDFGLARVAGEPTAPAGSARPPRTGCISTVGVAGTPAYMAPEQHDGRPADARSDQYSFCITAWEALTGAHPFASDDLDGLVAAKRRGPPPWPSESDVPRALVDALRRGLDPDPVERWPSMDVFLSALSPAPKARRRIAMLVGLAVVALAGAVASSGDDSNAACTQSTAGLDGVWDAAVRADVRRAMAAVDVPYAASAAEQATKQLDRYRERWIAQHAEACEATSILHAQPSDVLDLRMGCLRRAKMELQSVAQALRDPDARTTARAMALVESLPPVESCADVDGLRARLSEPPLEIGAAVEDVRADLARSRTARRAGAPDRAARILEEVAATAAALDYPPLLAELELERGIVAELEGDAELAQEHLEQALRVGLSGEQWDIARSAASRLVFVVGRKQARPTEGLVFVGIAQGLRERSGGGPLDEAELRGRIGSVLYGQGRYAEAELEQRAQLTALESEPTQLRNIAMVRQDLAMTLNALGRHAEAEALCRTALESLESEVGKDHPDVGHVRNNLVATLLPQSKLEEAEPELEAVLELLVGTLGPEHVNVAFIRSNLALIRHKLGKYEDAMRGYREALEVMDKTVGLDHPHALSARSNLATTLFALGRSEEAEQQHRKVLELKIKLLGPDHPDVAFSLNDLGALLQSVGRSEEAEPLLRDAIRIRKAALGPDAPLLVSSRLNLALSLRDQGRLDEAEAQARAAVELAEEIRPPGHPEIARANEALASTLEARRPTQQAGSGR
jgi:serine/threonine-protein kinase